MKPGDKVILKQDLASFNVFSPSAIVKLVSEGGTVITKSALRGRRCFEEHELERIDDAPRHEG